MAERAAAAEPGGAPVRGVALLLCAGTVMSMNGLLFRGVEAATDWQVIFWRSLWMAGVFAVALTVRERGRLDRAFRRAGLVALVAGVILGIGNVSFSLAILNTTVANALLILSASPFLSAIFAWLLMREAIGRVTAVAMVVALAGVAIMVFEGLGAGRFFGNLMAVLTLVTHAGFIVTLRYARNVDMLPSVCIAGCIAALGGAAASAPGFALALSANDFLMCALMGIGTMGLGFALFTMGARYLPAAQTSLLVMSEVILAPIWVWIFWNETPSSLTLIGGALVLSAVFGLTALTMRRGADRAL
ncbi:MAG: DMT family transporter [Rhodospirillaceae bacterium]|nr:DMT family transporter [Rhodospirillaceae bacterium]MBT6119652.1 DMT family transporter [Rhodospirillaceae bacterium]